jgi:hypothetical protein
MVFLWLALYVQDRWTILKTPEIQEYTGNESIHVAG